MLSAEECARKSPDFFSEVPRPREESDLKRQLISAAESHLSVPRALTFQQVMDLVYLTLNRSDVRTRVTKIESELKESQNEISKLHE